MSDIQRIRRADWVLCKLQPQGPYGFVTRTARDGTWADVRWPGGYVKRMQTEELIPTATIRLKDGTVVTDMEREKELR